MVFLNRLVYTPWIALWVGTGLSFLCWVLPDIEGLRRGFGVAEPLTVSVLLALVLWYGSVTCAIWMGFRIGQRIKMIKRPVWQLDNMVPYMLLTLFASLGVLVTTLYTIKGYGVSGVIGMLQSGQGNMVRQAIYESGSYAPGILSLRYIAAWSGSMGLFFLLNKQGTRVIHLYNILLWFICIFSAGRVALVAGVALLVVLYAASDWKEKNPVKWGYIIGGFLTLFIVLGVMNYARNAGYYQIEDASSFWLANIGEIVAYLGSPMQVFSGVANHMGEWLPSPNYYDYVDIEASLTTNSAFADTYTSQGWFGLVQLLGEVFAFSIAMGGCIQQRNSYMLLLVGAVLYAILEVWRIDIFSKGFFLTLFLSSLIVLVVSTYLKPRFWHGTNVHQ